MSASDTRGQVDYSPRDRVAPSRTNGLAEHRTRDDTERNHLAHPVQTARPEARAECTAGVPRVCRLARREGREYRANRLRRNCPPLPAAAIPPKQPAGHRAPRNGIVTRFTSGWTTQSRREY